MTTTTDQPTVLPTSVSIIAKDPAMLKRVHVLYETFHRLFQAESVTEADAATIDQWKGLVELYAQAAVLQACMDDVRARIKLFPDDGGRFDEMAVQLLVDLLRETT